MAGRILIILSYNGGDRHGTGYNAYQFLRIQHQQLTTLKHNLDKVLVVVNEPSPNPYDKEYEAALELFPHILRRSNQMWSYGGWQEGYLAEPDYEWYFFLEDDYTFFLDDFDQKWIDLWKPGMSYLATKIGNDFGYPLHASIANGLTRGDILKTVKWEHLTGSGEYDAALQIGWSDLFDLDGLADIRDVYAAPFYDHGSIINHGNPNFPLLVGPVQLITPEPIDQEIMPDRHKQRVEQDYDYRIRTKELNETVVYSSSFGSTVSRFTTR